VYILLTDPACPSAVAALEVSKKTFPIWCWRSISGNKTCSQPSALCTLPGRSLAARQSHFFIEQRQRVKTGGLKIPVVGALFLLSVHRDLGGIGSSGNRVHGFRFPDQSPVESRQSGKVLLPGPASRSRSSAIARSTPPLDPRSSPNRSAEKSGPGESLSASWRSS
jgi:hypothetical protein